MSKRNGRFVHIEDRSTGERQSTFDVTGWSATNFNQFWDGLVRKINFEFWCPVFEPERGDDETAAEWLAA